MDREGEQRSPKGDANLEEDESTTPTAVEQDRYASDSASTTKRPEKPTLTGRGVPFHPRHSAGSTFEDQLSPAASDRVFPIRSAVSVDPTSTPAPRSNEQGYFSSPSHSRKASQHSLLGSHPSKRDRTAADQTLPSNERQRSYETSPATSPEMPNDAPRERQSATLMNDIIAESTSPESSGPASVPSGGATSSKQAPSLHSVGDGSLLTARFKHVVTENGHAIITGRDGETLQRCEDEPIHVPGAVQGFGMLIALEEQQEGKLLVRVVSENAQRLIGFTPQQLFALESFTDILSEEQADNLLDHIDFIRDEDADVVVNGPEVFTLSIRDPNRRSRKLWCAVHINNSNPDLIICEFELEDDQENPLVPANEVEPEIPEDTLDSNPTAEEYAESTQNTSKPLRVLRSARKKKGEAAAMEVFSIMSQVQEQLAAAPNLEKFLKILVGVVKELTGFHRVMVYQFDQSWNGRVVTELVDPRATKDLYKGLNFPASDIPKQARDMYKINKVRMLYDRDQETARLVCRTMEDLETPLDMTHSYLRAMSPIHVKYLANMAVRSSMSISINAFDELWGLIACHTYGSKGMRVSFPIRKMCRLVGDSASRNIERLSYASRLQARKLINTSPSSENPSGYIIASSDDLLRLFDADFGLLSIRGETKILGTLERSQEALAMLEYLRMRSITNVMTSQDIKSDFPDLRYDPGFKIIAGLLLVPLSADGEDFIVFFRRGHLEEVKWAGNPYEKFVKEGTEGYLEPRKSFRTWSETVVGKCREWSEEEIETAAVLCLVYGKFIEVWRQKEAALQNSQLTRLLLSNSAHEVRTPLNAIINYLEIALEGTLDQETRDNLTKSHSASKSLIYVINDLLDLTKTEEGGDLVKGDVFELKATLIEATDPFKNDARRKNISFEISDRPGLPVEVLGDQRRVRQAISNVTANALKNTTQGGIKIEMYVASWRENHVDVEVSVEDTGTGISPKKVDALFHELEQVQYEGQSSISDAVVPDAKAVGGVQQEDGRALGLGLAVVARFIRNMSGQLRLKSEEGKGTRFVISFPFELPPPTASSTEMVAPPGSVPASASLQTHSDNLTPLQVGEMVLVRSDSPSKPGSSNSSDKHALGIRRSTSVDSMNSRLSKMSNFSNISHSSQHSGKSDADRLIEAMQEPHMVEGWSRRHGKGSTSSSNSEHSANARPLLGPRHDSIDTRGSPSKMRARTKSAELGSRHPLRQSNVDAPGQKSVRDSATPVKSVRVPDGKVVSGEGNYVSSWSTPPTTDKRPSNASKSIEATNLQASGSPSASSTSSDKMQILVAEDDPVNSRIIKKRLERLSHTVSLTVNGEECASAYAEKSEFYDIVLMDMQVSYSSHTWIIAEASITLTLFLIQMPIVDGLSSTKMIRSHEKTHSSHLLSARASLNRRVPIIAVSASLIEKERQQYINAGFDGWILKPISFDRLSAIMKGLVQKETRRANLYGPGRWEQGGWFQECTRDVFAADTTPSGKPPVHAPGHEASSEGLKKAAADDAPEIKEDADSVQTQEQQRLLRKQVRERDDAFKGEEVPQMTDDRADLPALGSKEYQHPEASGSDASSNVVTVTEKLPRKPSP